MAYIVKARFYSGKDQTGESYVITSDNEREDTKVEVGKKVEVLPIEEQVFDKDTDSMDVVKDKRTQVAEVFDKNPSETIEEKKPEPIRAILDLTDNKDISDSAACAASYVMPNNCKECPISRGCPHAYQNDECRQDLRNYFTRNSKDEQ